MLGIMLIEIEGNAEQLAQGMQYLNSQGINAEIIGYVRRNI